MLVRILLSLFTVLAVFLPISAQSISGTVTDAHGTTLPGVNVYFSETTLGTSTDEEGKFSFQTPASGHFDLVFSMIGYEKKRMPVNLTGRDLRYDVELQSISYELGEIEVVGSNREWKQNLEIFEREFIGVGQMAEQTEIVNPEVIDFERNSANGDLTASTQEPLVIENHALGYSLYLVLDAFEFDNRGTYGHFRVFPRFTELEAPDRQTRRRWERNRESVYRGSLQHFLRSLYNGRVSQGGFDIRATHDLVPMTANETAFALLIMGGIDKEAAVGIKGFRLHREVEVVHGVKSGFRSARGGDPFSVIRSVIFPGNREGQFFIDRNGNLLDPASLTIQGDWFSHRMAHRLPLDYK